MYISIDWRYFYCVFTTLMTSICEKKKFNKYLCRIHDFTEAATWGVLQKRCSEKFSNIHRKTPVLESLCGPSVCNFIKKRLQRWCFPVNTAKILRTPILKNIWERLLLILWKRIDTHSWKLNNSSKKIFNHWKSMNLQFCKRHDSKEKSKENAWKFNQIPCGKLSDLARKKCNFHM